MKTKTLKLTAILLIIASAFIACNGKEPEITGCNVENPLTDLPWLKAKTEDIALAISHGHPLTVSIYQSTFDNRETGFLIDKGSVQYFYNCEGELLCMSEINITAKNRIWEIDNDFINTHYPCYCIMDTLRGEWSWFETHGMGFFPPENEFKSIVRILSQNKDESINYEVFVADTLFYRGSFQSVRPQWGNNWINIRLPHWNPSDFWLFGFGAWGGNEPINYDILRFMPPDTSFRIYFYERIKR